MRKILGCIIVIGFFLPNAVAQNHFLVELENRTPDVKTLVMSYEGAQSIPFLAKDIKGVEHSSLDMVGKNMILWFWKNDCPMCIGQIDALNRLTDKYGDQLQVVSFSNNTKEEILALAETTPINFPVIPNSETLSEGPYGGDLGYPKIFICDENGRIKWAIPEAEMRGGNFDTYNFLETLHISLTKYCLLYTSPSPRDRG